MRKMSMTMRTELVAAIGERYRAADRRSKERVLDEFVAVTGFHRKHAMRLLRAPSGAKASGARRERRIYDEAVRTALVVLWKDRTDCAASGCDRSSRSCWRRWSATGIWTWHRR